MKKNLVVLVMLILGLVSVWGEGASIVVQNQESWNFWYVVDPAGFEEESAGSQWLVQKAAAYLAAENREFPFAVLQPGESTAIEGLEEGTHFLLGFFEDVSLVELPVRLVALQADQSVESRHYDIYSLPEIFLAARGVGMLAQFAPAEAAIAESESSASEAAEVDEAIGEIVTEEAVVQEHVGEGPAVEEPEVAEVAAEEVPSEQPAAEESTVEAEAAEEPAVEAEVAAEPAVAANVAEEPAVELPVAEEPVAGEAVAAEGTPIESAPAAKTAAEATVIHASAGEETTMEDKVTQAMVLEETAIAESSGEAASPGPSVLAEFSEAYDPVYFTRESRNAFVVLPIASSRAWGKPGTRLEEFSGSLSDGVITLVLRSAQAFARNVSCFFYVFPSRTAGGSSQYTFEARPLADGRAAVVLWEQGRGVPRLVGTAHTEAGEFRWTARADELPAGLAEQLGPATTFDLTTAWLDETSGTWEEFYFTTFALADLTR